MTTTRNETAGLVAQVAGWVDDLAEHARAAQLIDRLGDAAIPALRDYLGRGPQSIPQARCFAVERLAQRLGAEATNALREIFRMHPWHSQPAAFVQAEYVVKSDLLKVLAARSYPEFVADLRYGVQQRLRVAVCLVGERRAIGLARFLVDALDDDVLAADAGAALVVLGPDVRGIVETRLGQCLDHEAAGVAARLTAIRALRVLRHLATDVPPELLQRAKASKVPAVRAAAALVSTLAPLRAAEVEGLLGGALSFDRELAEACRAVLADVGEPLRPALERALARDTEPDLYGVPRPLSGEQRHWLVTRLRQLPTV
ncbi:MAG TPA: hypothetical protein VFQ88_10515 [Nevskiaceae bacterium]|nr:hypothetical protein [Nevskiaceae bacterium]